MAIIHSVLQQQKKATGCRPSATDVIVNLIFIHGWIPINFAVGCSWILELSFSQSSVSRCLLCNIINCCMAYVWLCSLCDTVAVKLISSLRFLIVMFLVTASKTQPSESWELFAARFFFFFNVSLSTCSGCLPGWTPGRKHQGRVFMI